MTTDTATDATTGIRPATGADIPFLVRAAYEADLSGTGTSSYRTLFDLTRAEAEDALARMLAEDVPHQELGVSGCLIAAVADQPLGACCAWVEGADGAGSALLKAALLHGVLGGQRIEASRERLRLLAPLQIARTDGAIQIESVYVAPGARGQGLAARLVEAQLERLRATALVPLAQVQLAGNNAPARAAYASLGFRIERTRRSDDPAVPGLLPCAERTLMQLTLERTS